LNRLSLKIILIILAHTTSHCVLLATFNQLLSTLYQKEGKLDLALAESLEGLYLIVAALPKDNLEIIYDNSKKTPKPKREGINSQFTKWGLLRSFLSALSQKGLQELEKNISPNGNQQ